MTQYRDRTVEIRGFILEHVEQHPKDISTLTAEKFGMSRAAVLRHIHGLIADGLLAAQGKTRDRQYTIVPMEKLELSLQITPELAEDVIWRQHIRPLLAGIPKNVVDICQYGLTEMLNNVVDHSGGESVFVGLTYTATKIKIEVRDDGVGVFRKIQTELGLEDQYHAILELSKGKLTTDPDHHTGEGIFFTSRVFDRFRILSGGLFFFHATLNNDWLLESEDVTKGTLVVLEIHPRSPRTLKSVFDYYTAHDDEYGFTRTLVPVTLARYGDENLVSRSQAKRLLARFDRFREVVLDFTGVGTIGHAFADEIFRVYTRQYPQVHLVPINTNQQVLGAILRVVENPEQWIEDMRSVIEKLSENLKA